MKSFIEKLRIDRRIRVGYGSAFFLLLISYILTLYANRELLEQTKIVDHTNKVINHLESLVSSVRETEIRFKSYLVVKDETFIEPFKSSRMGVDTLFYHLLEETSDNGVQQKLLRDSKKLVDEQYSIVVSTIDHFQRNHRVIDDSVLNQTYRGNANLDSLRIVIRNMQMNEQRLLEKRVKDLASRATSLKAIIMVSLVLAFLFMGFGFVTYLRENIARRRADTQVEAYQKELERRIIELGKANKELVQIRSIEKFASTGRIARTIAHEVRNPLTNINLAVDQLRGAQDNGEDGLLYEMITRNSDRINQLITSLLNSTKFTELRQENVSVNLLLDEALELASDRVALNNIKVIKKYSNDICDISVDKERIKIAFLNIIVNAIEAMEPGKGILTLHTKGQDDKCVIEITDNGRGMDKDSLSRVFEPYFTSKEKGTGLGLTNTQNIILNHKGTIAVESEPGKGTTFIITLDFSK